jgi:hypothetical protein
MIFAMEKVSEEPPPWLLLPLEAVMLVGLAAGLAAELAAHPGHRALSCCPLGPTAA